jgi:hypothetical protein
MLITKYYNYKFIEPKPYDYTIWIRESPQIT